jgi:hypothetical protein
VLRSCGEGASEGENEAVWKEDGEMIERVTDELRVRARLLRTHKGRER